MTILCPTDFSLACDIALAQAGNIASNGSGGVTLFHVLTKSDARGNSDADRHASTLDQLAKKGVAVTAVERKGDPLKEIVAEAGKGHTLMVCGTHGVQTLRQDLLGSDMLKLVREVPLPTLVVQRHSSPTAPLKRILMPVAGHDDISPLLDAVCMLAKLLGSEVIIYQQLSEGKSTPNSVLLNKGKMSDRLKEAGIPHREVNEAVGDFYKGFAERTLRYAREVGADCIAIMAQASKEHRRIADDEKQELLFNKTGIPVLCAR